MSNVLNRTITNYLKATEIEVGLELNFASDPEFKRIIYSNDKKTKKSVIICKIRLIGVLFL